MPLRIGRKQSLRDGPALIFSAPNKMKALCKQNSQSMLFAVYFALFIYLFYFKSTQGKSKKLLSSNKLFFSAAIKAVQKKKVQKIKCLQLIKIILKLVIWCLINVCSHSWFREFMNRRSLGALDTVNGMAAILRRNSRVWPTKERMFLWIVWTERL